MYKLVLIPEGAQAAMPEDLAHLLNHEPDLIAKIYAGREQEVLIAVSTRELQLLVEYRDMLPLELRAVIGLSGAMYNSVWNTYVATLERITLDTLRTEMQQENAAGARAGNDAIARPPRAIRVERAASVRNASDDAPMSDDPGIAD